MSKTLVAIATYNEIENLPHLVEAIRHHLPGVDILVIDDNSPDGTGAWCNNHKSITPNFDYIIRDGKLGLGTAILAAMEYAIANRYDFLMNLDADFSHPPQQLSEFLDAMLSEIDVAIGSRYVPGGKIEGWPLHRRMMSRVINGYARFCLGLPTRDNSGAFRCYRVSTLERVLAQRVAQGGIRSKGYSFFEEILFLLHRDGAKMLEIPITFTDRKFGKSKINLREAVKAIGIIFRLGLSRLRPCHWKKKKRCDKMGG